MSNVSINIESAFKQFETENELKEVAQSVVNQIKAAYDARLAELRGKTKIGVSVKAAGTTGAKSKKAAKAPNGGAKTAAKGEKVDGGPIEKKAGDAVKQVSISSLTMAQIKAMGLNFIKYSDKCMLLTGNTRCIKDEIKATGGAHWNGRRQGWFVKNDTAKELAKALKIKIA